MPNSNTYTDQTNTHVQVQHSKPNHTFANTNESCISLNLIINTQAQKHKWKTNKKHSRLKPKRHKLDWNTQLLILQFLAKKKKKTTDSSFSNKYRPKKSSTSSILHICSLAIS